MPYCSHSGLVAFSLEHGQNAECCRESYPGNVLLLAKIIAAMTAALFVVTPWSTAIIYGSTGRESGLVLLLFFGSLLGHTM